ncbi:hypothetical protein [Vibrio phage vB_VmeM-Yong XC32]|nr:hypothetical protein [Vibrio phage vB_VmeM-Yong XC31]QAX96591.1 hypothetical protein [Vibrio phage vB_VmeM-Yong XC32]QAX96909.1 hypothetical protein [Vibrio phage vB_VmeM-Yong MS31]QAX97214.1 hypothetical protein [Vibrio phage vB_VmeM-Yong MS32]
MLNLFKEKGATFQAASTFAFFLMLLFSVMDVGWDMAITYFMGREYVPYLGIVSPESLMVYTAWLLLASLVTLGSVRETSSYSRQKPREVFGYLVVLAVIARMCGMDGSYLPIIDLLIFNLQLIVYGFCGVWALHKSLHRIVVPVEKGKRMTLWQRCKDAIWFHRVKNTNECYLHLGDLRLEWGWEGPGWPRFEVYTGYGDETNFSLRFNFVLFGGYFSAELPFLSYLVRESRITGFYMCKEHMVSTFFYDDCGNTDGWRGLHHYLSWERLLKGRDDIVDDGGTHIDAILETSLYCEGYPMERVWFDVYMTEYKQTWSRWPGEKRWRRWSVKSRGDGVLKSAGKFGCDNEGIDISFGCEEKISGARHAVKLALQNLHETRKRRG